MTNRSQKLTFGRRFRYALFLSLAYILPGLAVAQSAEPEGRQSEQQSTEFNILFKVNSSQIDPALFDNASQINKAVRFLQAVKADPKVEIVNVAFCGTASPEGPSEFNRSLASRRLKAVENLVRGQIYLPDDIVSYDDAYIPWEWLREQVALSDMASKAEILAVLDSRPEMVSFARGDRRTVDSRVNLLKQIDGGRAWRELFNRFFSQMRMGSAVIVTVREVPAPPVAVPIPPVMEPVVVDLPVFEEEEVLVVEAAPDDWYRKMYIKSNIPAWALLWQNVALEVDLARHWSFALPVYWSPYNYGRQTLKFRTLAFVPEFRFWPRGDNMGFFINAHFGLAYYNYANGGDYRYQDHDGKTPAVGGGIGIGYRFYFCRNHRWSMEAAVGAGAYRLDYDIFQNTPSTSHGYLLSRRKRTFFGIDQAAFTISYSFGLRKKGGDK